jgi:hypothetical protein
MSGLDPRLRLALDASIGWYEDIVALHGIGSEIADGIWRSVGPPPPLHSDVVIVEPSATADALSAALAGRASWGYKDSFATLPPPGSSAELLFEATWIHRDGPATTPDARRPTPWRSVRSAAQLARWNAGWDTERVLLPRILDRGHLVILGRVEDGEIVAGAVARLGTGAVHISNVHGVGGHAVDWYELVAAVAATFPDRQLVGYERGDDLKAAIAVGFAPVGPLRVWVGHTDAVG